MEIELLYIDGCVNYPPLVERLSRLVREQSVPLEIRHTRVVDVEQANGLRFPGSPTVRIDGVDVEPDVDAGSDFGMQCRLYSVGGGFQGAPPDEWILAAVDRVREQGDGRL
jgi:hypothetical protein